jgi:hypothetical protein
MRQIVIVIDAEITDRKALAYLDNTLNKKRSVHHEALGLIIDRRSTTPIYTIVDKEKNR